MNRRKITAAIDAASKLSSGLSTQVRGAEHVHYVSDGRGNVTRVEHFCNAGGGRAISTHREKLVRRA